MYVSFMVVKFLQQLVKTSALIYVTRFRKMCIVHRSNFTLEIHENHSVSIDLKFSGMM